MKTMKIKLTAMAAVAALVALGGTAQAATFIITYSGQGTSGTAYVTGTSVGGGEYDLTSGVLHSNTLGTETLVPGSGIFKNTNGDNLSYDDKLFFPENAPASPDGANLTYDGGLVFQTAVPSKQDVYFSAYYPTSNNPAIFYFAGYDRSYGKLDSFSVAPAPEPAAWVMMLLGVGMIGGGLRMARRRNDLALTTA
jgi:PEP-CTERM motif